MKFIGREQEQFGQEKYVVEMNDHEKSLFLAILSLFPQVPVGHHQLSQGADLPNAGTNQLLLEESLKTQKNEAQAWIKSTFKDPHRFQPVKTGETGFSFHLAVTRPEIEMLLQIFNDVRLGCWLTLGSPDLAEKKKKFSPTQQTAPLIQRMELAGLFEVFFIKFIHEPDVQ
ncbi:MAG: hypothetical protein ABSE48_12975 [Verrucomicrobiota bacterium]